MSPSCFNSLLEMLAFHEMAHALQNSIGEFQFSIGDADPGSVVWGTNIGNCFNSLLEMQVHNVHGHGDGLGFQFSIGDAQHSSYKELLEYASFNSLLEMRF